MKKTLAVFVVGGLIVAGAPLVSTHQAGAEFVNHDPQLFLMEPGCFLNGYDVSCPWRGRIDFYRDFPAKNSNGTIHQVVEIPAGTNAKFEVNEQTGKMSWEIKDGAPRLVHYAGYVGNYGVIPRTLSGDGDGLDVVTLGRLELRASVVKAKVVGVLKLVDGGEPDEKLIAVLPDSVLGGVNNLAELNAQFPGVAQIIESWFLNYKGPGEIASRGFGDVDEANLVLEKAIRAYRP